MIETFIYYFYNLRGQDVIEMMEIAEKEKVEALERILKSLTYADEIRYKKYSEQDWLIVEVIGVDPNHFEFKGYSEGLDINWDTEPYIIDPPEHMKDELLPIQAAKIVANVWVMQDHWELIDKLEAEVKRLSSKVKADG